MRTDPSPKSPNSDESPNQKQDPLERRRLQNRLSQRNHRRKIRDRIAKLQERVIANELRAAAALNGWDQPYTQSPLISPCLGSHHDTQFSHSRDPSPLATEPSTPFMPPYTMPPTPPWSSEWPGSQPPGLLSGDGSFFMDGGFMGSCSAPTSSSLMNTAVLPCSGVGPERDVYRDTFANSGSFSSDCFSSAPTGQPLYYVATETALPQILQVLNNVSPQSNIIVLVPDSASSATVNPNPASGLLGNNTLDPMQAPQMNALNSACQCQTQNIQASPASQMISRTWQSPGSYMAGCQPHKQSSTGGTFPVMRL